MVKQRLSTADVAAEVSCLKKLLGMRLANMYDINPKVCAVGMEMHAKHVVVHIR